MKISAFGMKINVKLLLQLHTVLPKNNNTIKKPTYVKNVFLISILMENRHAMTVNI